MNLREIIRKYDKCSVSPVWRNDLAACLNDLDLLEAEILKKAKKAWQDTQSGCTPCQEAAAAYMDILGPNDPTEQLKEVKISLSPKK